MKDFTFDDSTHTYRLKGRIIPGVTSVLQDNFGTRPYWSEWHANRGKAVHLSIHYMIQNRLDWNTVDERIKARIEAFQKCIKENNFQVEKSEIKLCSNRYRFAGTLDLILQGDILADIKSSIEPMVDLQLAAYSLLWEENNKTKIKKACAIELKENGNYKLKWVKDIKKSQRIFLASLTVANWKNLNY